MRRYLLSGAGAYFLLALVFGFIENWSGEHRWSPLHLLGQVLYNGIVIGIPLLMLLLVAYVVVGPLGSASGRSVRAILAVAAVGAGILFSQSEGSERLGLMGVVAVWAALSLGILLFTKRA
jgi:hypothetical protein